MPPTPDPRPPLAFRVGITGSRHLDAAEIAGLRAPVAAVLARVRDTLYELAAEQAARAVYRHVPGHAPQPHLRLLSPLAEGADRLVAEEALALNYDLFAPLPFAQATYEADFRGSVAPFRHLLAHAQVLALDGGRGRDEAASYEAVGRFVARNCDILVALWDGTSDDKRGGTGQTVQFAVRETVPVWWIDTATGAAHWIAKPAHLRHRDRAPGGAAAERALVADLRAIVLPPVARRPEREGIMSWAAHHFRRFRRHETAPLALYLGEPARLPTIALWSAYRGMQTALAVASRPASARPATRSGADATTARDDLQPASVRPASTHPASARPATTLLPALSVEGFWAPVYDRADALSVGYGDRYRSSYVLVIALAFLAVTVAAFGGASKAAGLAALPTLVELALLVAIGGLVFANHVGCWQERWITYRLLAELCRKQMVLAILGRSLPGAEVNRSAAEAAAAHHAQGQGAPGHGGVALPSREAWVGWYLLACQRAAPPPTGDIAPAIARALAVGRTLAAGQRAYHAMRRGTAATAEHRLAAIGEVFFLCTGAGLLLRLFFFTEGAHLAAGEWIETIAVFLSSLSAAFVGLRAYSEFALLARQSVRMEDLMRDAEADLGAIVLGPALVSDELGGLLHRLAMAMMQEVRGWAQLFRLKSVETG